MTARQDRWIEASDEAARNGEDVVAGLFALIALPNDQERVHSCREHAVGFRAGDVRGFRCGICRTVISTEPVPARFR